MLVEGDAVYSVGKVELNKVNYVSRVGRVLYNQLVPLWDTHSRKLADFSSHFQFTVDTQNASVYGHGLSFFLAPAGFQIPPNSVGGFLGLFNTTTTDSARSQIVSVEFDSYFNEEWDPVYQHVGINKNSISSSVTAPWNVSLRSGQLADAWVVYNATAKNLSVFWSYGSDQNSSLSYPINLMEILPQWVTLGICAATGSNVERHILESWQFSSSVEIATTSRNSKTKIPLIVGLTGSACFLLAVGMVIFFVIIKCKRGRNSAHPAVYLTSTNEDLERGSGPKRFSYKLLASATDNFADEKKLGEGGFGGVYRGHLTGMDMPIAVKRISRRSKQGKKQYMTEVKIISMLRHRNLVQLIGWCHDRDEFLLVYEFMTNGSLDYHLFGKRDHLSWANRYKISVGLASALLYLHEEWEQCVVHRDIKSSNVMLDANFNVKLGDFGLARLMDHDLGPQTTGLAGTLGYLAPEYVSTGRASKESDVYSFGVVALEIATGRKSTDPLDDESMRGLVEWVWDLFGNGQILSAVDEKLQGDFDAEQVECLMMVGLWCAHPDRTLRSSIRQASLVLNFEANWPQLPRTMPVASYHVEPVDPSVSSGQPSLTVSSIDIRR